MMHIDLARPPFAWDTSTPPHVAAECMVACFAALADRPDRMRWSFQASVEAIGGAREHALYRAGQAIAADIDRGIGAGIPGGYHTPQHFLEVVLSALYLCGRAGLAADAALLVLSAALVHDFHYDGIRDRPHSFRLEAIAVREAMPYLQAAGVDDETRRRLEILVLSTEPTEGVPFARACHAFHRGGTALPAGPPPLPALAALRTDSGLALEATLLTEADVLPSIGLTVAHGNHVQSLLAAEWGRPLGAEDKLHFIDDVFGDFQVAGFFSPNLAALREDCLRRLGGGGQPP